MEKYPRVFKENKEKNAIFQGPETKVLNFQEFSRNFRSSRNTTTNLLRSVRRKSPNACSHFARLVGNHTAFVARHILIPQVHVQIQTRQPTVWYAKGFNYLLFESLLFFFGFCQCKGKPIDRQLK